MDTPTFSSPYPSLDQLRRTADRLHGKVLETPVWRWQTGIVERALAPSTEVWLKLELFQRTGTFKLRGALNSIGAMDAGAMARGVVAASAGNHAIAVAYAAKVAGTHAKVCMPRSASPMRIAACEAEGAQVLLVDSVHEAFALALRLVEEERRTMIHPFDGPLTAEGTGTVGLELMRQVPNLDAVVVPVGGGGLCAGIAAAVKQINPDCLVFGIEPYGADAMYRSFRAGEPAKLDKVDTIADSLGAPYALPYSYGVCRRFVDDIVRVWDEELCRAMAHLYQDMKLVAEPAAAAATAALLGPLRSRLDGKRVALVVCGSNIDSQRFSEWVARGAAT
ncbi:threonine/serine dehydratase [Rhizobacter sp. Root1221]|uniref:threonine ammonia-lyase n=1 Tax=Rhizobacter sp. Root1221 TaxID=1736433 RepID=UPI0006F71D14|nr:threonine/serine dehydratase [Rhizobacter sp. Root1221]KQW01319.1 pyridoxal-5'-phosphate-dependent protein subunit beta [Rhizobacter sp. Root1221]